MQLMLKRLSFSCIKKIPCAGILSQSVIIPPTKDYRIIYINVYIHEYVINKPKLFCISPPAQTTDRVFVDLHFEKTREEPKVKLIL